MANCDDTPFGKDNLRIASFDANTSTWTLLSSTIDEETNTISAPITSLGIYTVSAATVEDNQTPTVTWQSPLADAELDEPTLLQVKASDNIGVAGVKFFIDDSEIADDQSFLDGGWYAEIDFSQIVAGQHTIKAEAYDRAGNVQEVTRTITVQSTATAPFLTMRSVLYDAASKQFVANGIVYDRDGSIADVVCKLDNDKKYHGSY